MSILIKGMEMPEHCGYCRFRYDGICHALQKTQYRKEECPLVPVPPHGRTIDADAIPYKKIMYDEETDEFYYGVTKPYIDRMPTIIEAEEETEWKHVSF